MNVRLAFALPLLLFLGSPVYAQSPCAECLKAAEENLKTCLADAISVDDQISCEDDVCKIERENRDTKSAVPSQNE
jgi:hypothetical protein